MQELKYFSTFNRCNVNQDKNFIKLRYLPSFLQNLHSNLVGVCNFSTFTRRFFTKISYPHIEFLAVFPNIF